MAFQTNGYERHDVVTVSANKRCTRCIAPDVRSKVVYGAGVCGVVACSVAMVALPLGLVAAGVTSGAKAASGSESMGAMSGMSAGTSVPQPGWLSALLTYGPELLIGSILLIVLAFALRRSWWAVAALIGGTILYVGMYLQPSVAVMNGSIIVGIAILAASALAFRRPIATKSCSC